MPLSDREQQILREIEDQLYEQDPDFARGVSSTTLQTHLLRNIKRGFGAFVAGLVVLMVFFFQPLIPIGVVAFLLMVAAAVYTYENLRKLGSESLRLLREQRTPFAELITRLRTRIKELGKREGS